jgi:transposase
LYLPGEKQNKLAEIFSVNKSTISKLIKKFQKEENHENNSNRGRTKLMDERDDRLLIRSVKKNRRQTLNEISIDYNNHAPQKVSTRKIQRRLHFYGFKRHKVRKTLTVSEPNRKRRLQWCKSLKCHTIDNYWKNVIFSDETRVVISNENRLYVWRTADEAYRPVFVGQQ